MSKVKNPRGIVFVCTVAGLFFCVTVYAAGHMGGWLSAIPAFAGVAGAWTFFGVAGFCMGEDKA